MSIFPMAVPTPGGEASEKSWWLYLLLGIVLLIAGAVVLGDVVLASVVSGDTRACATFGRLEERRLRKLNSNLPAGVKLRETMA